MAGRARRLGFRNIVLDYVLSQDGFVTVKKVAKEVGVPQRSAQHHLNELTKERVISHPRFNRYARPKEGSRVYQKGERVPIEELVPVLVTGEEGAE